MKIGFIGLGIMGKPMAKNLLKAGYNLTVSKVNKASPELVSAGAILSTNSEIGYTCDIIFTILPNGPEVKTVRLREDGVGYYLKKGSIFIGMSSINPVVSKEIYSVLSERSSVSDGEPKVIDGTLSFMVCGKQEVFDKCKPILSFVVVRSALETQRNLQIKSLLLVTYVLLLKL